MKKNNEIILAAVYVDDIVKACKDKQEIYKIKALIAGELDISDKARMQHFMGMEIEQKTNLGSIKLYQVQYVNIMLERSE